LLHSILYDASFHYNLLNIVGIGHSVLQQLLDRRKLKEGQTLEKLVVIGFTVLENVLLLKQENGFTSLELSIMNRKIGKNNEDLILVIASYIHYSYSYQLPLLATRVLTLLCGITLNAKSRPSSLIGYFGNQIEDLRTTYLWKLGDRRENIDLKIAILHFITITLDTQPGLAELFINLSLENNQPTSGQHDAAMDRTTHSVIDIILSMLDEQDTLIARQPRLLSAALSFLCALWKDAPDHHRAITFLRGRKNFWVTLLRPLASNPYEESSNRTNDNNTEMQGDASLETTNKSYRILIRAHIFEILALEIFYVPAIGDIDSDLVAMFNKFRDEKIFTSWISWYVQSAFHPETKKRLLEAAQKMNINIDRCVVLEPHRIYGRNYYYDITLLQRKFGLLANTEFWVDPGNILVVGAQIYQAAHNEQANDVLKWAMNVNEELSLIDVQQIAVHSWRSFCEVAISRQPRHPIVEGKTLIEAIHTLGVKLAKETRDGIPITLMDKEICGALLFLTRKVTLAIQNEYQKTKLFEERQSELVVTHSNEGQTAQISRNDKYNNILLWILGDFTQSLQHVIHSMSSVSEEMALSVLASISMLMKCLRQWDTLQLSTLIDQLVPTLLECIEKKSLMALSLIVLESITRNFPNSILVLSHLREKMTIVKLLEKLNDCLQNQREENTAESILFFFLSLSQNSLLAESMAIDGLMGVACNESFAYFCRINLYPYTTKGERNTWHRVWCYLLSVVSNSLRSLGSAENFVSQVNEFVSVHQMRITKMLNFIKLQPGNIAQQLQNVSSPSSSGLISKLHEKVSHLTITETDSETKKASTISVTAPFSLASLTLVSELSPVLTFASLDEAERITVLLYELSRRNSQWMIIIDPKTVEQQQIIVKNIQYIALLLLYPPKIIQSAIPISSAERKAHKKSSEIRSLQEPKQRSSQEASQSHKTRQPSVSFIERIEQSLYTILRDSIAFVRTLISPPISAEILECDDNDDALESFTPLFTASLEVSLSGSPSLGILLNCANICALNLKKLVAQEAQTNLEDMILLHLYIIENALYVVVAHIIFYLSPRFDELMRQRVRDECGNELETIVSRLNKDLNKILSKTKLSSPQKEKKVEYFKKLEVYVQQVIKN
jgi:hypothetical protein